MKRRMRPTVAPGARHRYMPSDELALCVRLGLLRQTGAGDHELTGAGLALLAPTARLSVLERARKAFASRHEYSVAVNHCEAYGKPTELRLVGLDDSHLTG